MNENNANLDIVRELIVPAIIRTEANYKDVHLNSVPTNDIVYIQSKEESSSLDNFKHSDFAIACGSKCDSSREWAFAIMTRTPIEDKIVFKSQASMISSNSSFFRGQPSIGSCGIKPMINLDVRQMIKYKDALFPKSNPESWEENLKNGRVFLGEMPQNAVFGKFFVAQLNSLHKRQKLEKSGKAYLGAKGEVCKEYKFNNSKYVLMQNPNPFNKYETWFASREERVKTEPTWFEVSPIAWKIENWENMPTEINPNGDGTAKVAVLKTENILIDSIPFSLSDKSNANQWASSDVRCFLNGLEKERSYTHPETKESIHYKFNKTNFLNSCLEFYNYPTKEKDEEIEIPTFQYKKSKGEKPKMSEKLKDMSALLEVRVAEEDLTVSEQIEFYIKNGKSFMLHGASGVGKTRRIEEADPDFVSIVLRNGMLPEEVIGKTIFPNNDTSKESIWMSPAWYSNLCKKCEAEPDKNHILFIDEITNVKPAEQSLVFHLVLNRSIGPNIGKLPDNVVVVAAGNNKQESEAAYNMPEPLFRRFEGHIYLEPDVREFITWGADLRKDGLPKIHPLISRFVGTYGSSVFYSPYDSEEPPKYALDPRGWEQVSDIIYANNGVLSKQLLANKIGTEVATSLISFSQQRFTTIEDILTNNFDPERFPAGYDYKLALAFSLLPVDEENVQTIRKFIAKYLSVEILSTFDYKWVGDNEERAILLSGLNNDSKKGKSVEPKQLDDNQFDYSKLTKKIKNSILDVAYDYDS